MNTVVVVLGPTASGKSGLGLQLARRLGGELVNADSRQVYRGMDIGTAKPSQAERAMLPHHLFDCVDPSHTYTAADFALQANALLDRLERRGCPAVVVGGTGLYLRALLDGLFDGPSRGPLHRRLERLCEEFGVARMRRWLEQVDPDWAARIGARDRQRILRGLDVYLQTGRPISLEQRRQSRAGGRRVLKLAIAWEREELYRRIETRVDAMLAAGLVDEVRRLAAGGNFRDCNAARSVGYAEVLAMLAGRLDEQQLAARIKQSTRRLAKRQLTWFRKEPGVCWLPAGDLEQLTQQALELVEAWRLRQPGPAAAECALQQPGCTEKRAV